MHTVDDDNYLGFWQEDGFRLDLWADHSSLECGILRDYLAYRLTDGGEVIFEGKDFGCSPLHCIDDLRQAAALLSFLSLGEWDVDSEYFDDYTPRQLEWRDSSRREDLQWLAFELEERLTGTECLEWEGS